MATGKFALATGRDNTRLLQCVAMGHVFQRAIRILSGRSDVKVASLSSHQRTHHSAIDWTAMPTGFTDGVTISMNERKIVGMFTPSLAVNLDIYRGLVFHEFSHVLWSPMQANHGGFNGFVTEIERAVRRINTSLEPMFISAIVRDAEESRIESLAGVVWPRIKSSFRTLFLHEIRAGYWEVVKEAIQYQRNPKRVVGFKASLEDIFSMYQAHVLVGFRPYLPSRLRDAVASLAYEFFLNNLQGSWGPDELDRRWLNADTAIQAYVDTDSDDHWRLMEAAKVMCLAVGELQELVIPPGSRPAASIYRNLGQSDDVADTPTAGQPPKPPTKLQDAVDQMGQEDDGTGDGDDTDSDSDSNDACGDDGDTDSDADGDQSDADGSDGSADGDTDADGTGSGQDDDDAADGDSDASQGKSDDAASDGVPGDGASTQSGPPKDPSSIADALAVALDQNRHDLVSTSANDSVIDAVNEEIRNGVLLPPEVKPPWIGRPLSMAPRSQQQVEQCSQAVAPLTAQIDSYWEPRTTQGKLNMKSVMTSRGRLDVFKRWHDDLDDATSFEIVVGIDVSTSMQSDISYVSADAWVIKTLADRFNAPCTVMTYNTAYGYLYERHERADKGQIRSLSANGGTLPDAVINNAAVILKNSPHKHRIFVMLTDGEWASDFDVGLTVMKMRAEGIECHLVVYGRDADSTIGSSRYSWTVASQGEGHDAQASQTLWGFADIHPCLTGGSVMVDVVRAFVTSSMEGAIRR